MPKKSKKLKKPKKPVVVTPNFIPMSMMMVNFMRDVGFSEEEMEQWCRELDESTERLKREGVIIWP